MKKFKIHKIADYGIFFLYNLKQYEDKFWYEYKDNLFKTETFLPILQQKLNIKQKAFVSMPDSRSDAQTQ